MIYSIIKEYLCHFQYLATFNSSVTVLYLYLVNFGTYFYSVYSEEHNRWVKNLVYSVLLESAKKFTQMLMQTYSQKQLMRV